MRSYLFVRCSICVVFLRAMWEVRKTLILTFGVLLREDICRVRVYFCIFCFQIMILYSFALREFFVCVWFLGAFACEGARVLFFLHCFYSCSSIAVCGVGICVLMFAFVFGTASN